MLVSRSSELENDSLSCNLSSTDASSSSSHKKNIKSKQSVLKSNYNII